MSDTTTLLLIAGTGQNGATLLSRVLGGIPGVVAIGEIGHLWDKALIDGRECGCGQPLASCPFWSRVGREAFGGWDAVDARRATAMRGSLLFRRLPVPHPFALPFILHPRLSASYARNLRGYRDLMARLYRGVAAVSGAAVIVDSMKVPAHVYAMSGVAGVEPRVVHLVRDSRGVAFSSLKVVKRQGAGYRVRRRPVKSGMRWLWINESFQVLARRGVPTLVVRYEELMRSPREELRRVAAFAGVDLGDEALGLAEGGEVELPADHLVAGNRMRFETGRTRLRTDEAWRRELTAGQRRAVSAVTWPLLLRYGYAPGPRASGG